MTFDLFDTPEEAKPLPEYVCKGTCAATPGPHDKPTECGKKGCLYVRLRQQGDSGAEALAHAMEGK